MVMPRDVGPVHIIGIGGIGSDANGAHSGERSW